MHSSTFKFLMKKKPALCISAHTNKIKMSRNILLNCSLQVLIKSCQYSVKLAIPKAVFCLLAQWYIYIYKSLTVFFSGDRAQNPYSDLSTSTTKSVQKRPSKISDGPVNFSVSQSWRPVDMSSAPLGTGSCICPFE